MTSQPPNDGQQTSSTAPPKENHVQVPPTVYAQLEALRQSGVVNMFTEVRAGLRRFEFTEAHDWIEANPETYADGFHNGFVPTDPEAVEEIDPDKLAEMVSDEPRLTRRDDASTHHERHILDHLESKLRFSEQAETYYSTGTWRETAPLTYEELKLAELFDEGVDCQNQQCYRNALLTAATFGEQYDVVYVEGYTMTDSLVTPIDHAWVEIEGKVLELTFPDGPQPETDAAYLGVEFSLDKVKSKVFDEKVAEPIASESFSSRLS
ncbi:hypothetical protein [Haloarchaeobius sp. TZWSO28]|uniref:hypothetical protein n=1 Tax=Haloarchaeobius sp. TZWSO28 TaxID=3446119 RepID=UPI003EC094C8